MLPDIDTDFFINFLNQIVLNINELVPILLRELNETWKFFSYFLKMLRFYPNDRQEFAQLHDIIKSYAASCYAKEPRRVQKVFLESLVQILIGEVRVCKEWKKREKLMFLVYEFNGRDISEKKVALNKLKVSDGLRRRSSAATVRSTSSGWQCWSRRKPRAGTTWATS